MPVGEVMLTARFKVDLVDVDGAVISEIYRLSEGYREVVNELIDFAASNHITSFIELYHAKYQEPQQRCPTLPLHYIFTACRYAASIYKSFIRRRRLGMCEREKPMFKRWVIWLDKKLFKLDAENWRPLIAAHGGRWITLRLLNGKYHERFKGMRIGEARLVLKEDGDLYLNVSLSQMVTLPEINANARLSPSMSMRTLSRMAAMISSRGLRRMRGS